MSVLFYERERYAGEITLIIIFWLTEITGQPINPHNYYALTEINRMKWI